VDCNYSDFNYRGWAVRSVPYLDDQEAAQLMGINNAHLFALAMALSLSIVSIAGVFLGIRTNSIFDWTNSVDLRV